MEKMFCANETCPLHTEHRGGEFRLVDGKWYCKPCSRTVGTSQTCKDLWNFTTTHLDGTPVKVKSLAHMRQLEKQYGVSNCVANNDQRNWDR